MPSTPKGLSDEKAARVLVAFREGRTLRQFAIRAGFDANCKAHPEYAREALPLLEETETGLLATSRCCRFLASSGRRPVLPRKRT